MQPHAHANTSGSQAAQPRDAGPIAADAADSASPAKPQESPAKDASAPVVTDPGVVVADPTDEAALVFDPDLVRTFDVEIAPADLAMADSNPAAEQYVPARLTFEGKTHEVGYRYKGSLGAFYPPCTNFLTGAKEGKCSVKLSFNWKDPEGRFFGLKKLLFHAMNSDPSMMRERLGYSLFRAMGVPASRATHAVLRVNGQANIYALVEEVDGRFTRSRFSEGGKGNLYKEIWPITEDPTAYITALETNEDQMPSVERIQRFQKAVAEGSAAMTAWMDTDVTTSYMAVDRVIMNDDGAFHFYCFDMAIGNNPKPPGNHNYYWYEAKDADRLWIIPWDLDNSMTDVTTPPHLAADWRKTPAPDECNVCETGGQVGAPPSGCDPVIRNWQALNTDYDAQIDRFIDGPFSKASVDANLAKWKQQIVYSGFPVQEAAITQLTQILDRARMNRGFMYP